MSDRVIIRAFMQSLVERAGGVDAAAAIIGARHGAEVSKGTISKRLAGQLDWPLVEIMALEDAVGDPCVRRWLSRSLPEVSAGQSLIAGVALSAREHGEALGAVMGYVAGQTPRDVARKEVQDACAASAHLAALIDRVEE
jgi:hypothetical protein